MSELIFTSLGLVVGVISLLFLVNVHKRGPESLKPAVLRLIFGISAMVVAFIWDLLFNSSLFNTLELPDFHHLLMTVSILFFANAAQKFYQIGK